MSEKKQQSRAHSVAAPQGKRGRVRRRDEESRQPEAPAEVCVACGGPLLFLDEVRLCPKCNSAASHELAAALSNTLVIPGDDEQQFIDCPGATLYDERSGLVVEGADFVEHDAGVYEVKLVKRAIFPPGHCRKRVVKREAFGKIRRCQACQDYTVRMRRREGPDFCVPSKKFPHRKKLKPVDFVSHTDSR
ncbi:MAG TPA: hypothetical protein VLB27_02725 [candidate division Zixibacteria bacterium]|nr:hypothetical protein [candidate division Zixibacteria bacterium]